MKKIFLKFSALAIAVSVISCGNAGTKNDSADADSTKKVAAKIPQPQKMAPLTPPEFKNLENIDTLSYAYGCVMSRQLIDGILPQLNVDFNAIVENIEKAANKESIKAEGVTITESNLRDMVAEHISPKIIAAMRDTTGTAKIFNSDKEKKIGAAVVGAELGYSLNKLPFQIDTKSVVAALNDSYNNVAKMNETAAMETIDRFFSIELPAKNKKESAEWLEKIKGKSGVQSTKSGLLYRIVKPGNTKATKDTDVVKVIYTGRTRKGVVFDSNRWSDMPEERQAMAKAQAPDKTGKDNPIEFPLNRVIPGWTEGMKLIGKGGKIELWIPSELAYGEQGAGMNIGPNEALFFEVELLDVTSK